MADHPDAAKPKSVAFDGVPIGELLAVFENADDLVAALRARASYVGVSYGMIEHLTGLGEGSIGKYIGPTRAKQLTIASLTRIASVLGLRTILVVDETLTRRHQSHWGQRDAAKAHAGHHRHRRERAAEQETAPQA